MHSASTPPRFGHCPCCFEASKIPIKKISIVSIVDWSAHELAFIFEQQKTSQEEVAGHFLPEETPSEAGTCFFMADMEGTKAR